MTHKRRVTVRNTRQDDFSSISELCTRVYPVSKPWNESQLRSHLEQFPEGQMVAVDASGEVVGMSASLIVRWDDYSSVGDWKAFTASGTFTNHDPLHGQTLYGAEVMVDPSKQRLGVGGLLYEARRNLVRRLKLKRIRAGARLRGYSKYASAMDARTYVLKVVEGVIKGPTLSFQLRHKFSVLDVVPDYLQNDPESLGYAALIEWVNREVVTPEEYALRKVLYLNPMD